MYKKLKEVTHPITSFSHLNSKIVLGLKKCYFFKLLTYVKRAKSILNDL